MKHLLLLHGAIGVKDQLEPLADQLKGKYHVHLLDFSGHGGTTLPDVFSIPVFAADVLEYLKEKNIQKVSIFGYSMGGYVAMYLARHYPQVIDKIITLATKFHWDNETAQRESAMLNADKILEKLPAFAGQLEKRHAPNDWKTVLEKTKHMLLELGRDNTLNLKDYTHIAANSLLLLGDKDKMITREETLAVQKALLHAEFRLLADTQHPLEQVDTQLLAGIIVEFA